MYVKNGNKIVNLKHCTSVTYSKDEIRVFYQDASEILGKFSPEKAEEVIAQIYRALEEGRATLELK